MSLRPDGTYHCDRCGVDVGNGSVHEAAIGVIMHPTRPFETLQVQWCRVNGCDVAVVSADALADWLTDQGVSS